MNISPFGSFLIIILAVGIYGLVHSILAAHSVKALARRWFGPRIDRVYRLAYNLFAIASLLPVFALVPILPDRTLYAIPLPWSLLTLGGQAVAAVALVVGLLNTGVWSFTGVQQLSGVSDPDEGRLVADGFCASRSSAGVSGCRSRGGFLKQSPSRAESDSVSVWLRCFPIDGNRLTQYRENEKQGGPSFDIDHDRE